MPSYIGSALASIDPYDAGMGGMRMGPQVRATPADPYSGVMSNYIDRRRDLSKEIAGVYDEGAGAPTKKQLWGALARVGAQLARAGGDPDVSVGEGAANALTAAQGSLAASRQTNRQKSLAKLQAKSSNLDAIRSMLVDERDYRTGRADERFDRQIGLLGAQTDQAQIDSLDKYRQGRLKQDAALTPLEQAQIAVYNARAGKYQADAAAAGQAGGNGAAGAFPAGWEWKVDPGDAHTRYQDYLDGRKAGRDELGAPIYLPDTMLPDEFYDAKYERIAPPVTSLGVIEQMARERQRSQQGASGPYMGPVPLRPNDYSDLW